MRPVRSGQQVADIAKMSYAGFGGTAKHASVGMWVGFTRENMPPRAWSTRGRGRAATDTLAQAIPNRARCSSHAIGRRVSPASFFALSSSAPDAPFRRGLMRPVRSGQQVADIAKISYAGFGGTAKHASAGMWVGFTRENMPPRAWSTRGRGRAETDTLAQAIPKRTRCSSHAIGRRVSPASFFAVSSSGWRSRRMVFTTSGARKLSRRIRVK